MEFINDKIKIVIEQDQCPDSPIHKDDIGKMYCFHNRYSLGHKHSYHNPMDLLSELLEDAIGVNEAEAFIKKTINQYDTSRPIKESRTKVIHDAIVAKASDRYMIKPLYLYDHSGLSISTSSYIGRAQHASWDSGIVGWVVADKEKLLKEFCNEENPLETAERLINADVEVYDLYLRGEVYQYTVYQADKCKCCNNIKYHETDSVYGFYGIDSVKQTLVEIHPEYKEEIMKM